MEVDHSNVRNDTPPDNEHGCGFTQITGAEDTEEFITARFMITDPLSLPLTGSEINRKSFSTVFKPGNNFTIQNIIAKPALQLLLTVFIPVRIQAIFSAVVKFDFFGFLMQSGYQRVYIPC